MNKRVSKSLRLELFCAVLASITVGVLVFVLSFVLGYVLLDNTVYAKSFAESMSEQYAEQLQDYVTEENISINNLQRLNAWCSRGDKVYLTIYEGENLIYESPFSGRMWREPNLLGFDPDKEDPDNLYPLLLAEDVEVRAYLYYYSGDHFYYGQMFLAFFIAFVAFSICFIIIINRKLSYIQRLKDELDILSGGQLEYAVTIQGCDELSELALGIDQMRRSILRHQETEKQVRSANSELITAMSHDLRTPLTSLLAYLEIIDRKKYADEQQMQELVHKSIGQTMRIRHMADKLFEYFLVYATEWEAAALEEADGDLLFLPILEDYAYSLENSGFTVKTDFAQVSGQVNVNMELLQRALDNLYSNLLKYADREQPVFMSYGREEGSFRLSIRNGIAPDQDKNKSTEIGLHTCRRILQYHGGSFEAKAEGSEFSVVLTLPLEK